MASKGGVNIVIENVKAITSVWSYNKVWPPASYKFKITKTYKSALKGRNSI